MKTKLLLLVTVLLTIILKAQVSIEGNITDENGIPISEANILILSTNEVVSTDHKGSFAILINRFPFKITISHVGYQNTTKTITDQNKIYIQLLTLNVLEEVVLAPSRSEEKIKESSVTIERLSLKDIRKTTSVDFYNALENLKGIDKYNGSLTYQAINTRGFFEFINLRFLQLIDGVNNASTALNVSFGNLFGLNELDIASVELLPGASSAIYGTNAFNGAMFMKSKSPFKYPSVSAYAKTGLTSSNNAGENIFFDVGFRVAHVFSKNFSAKASLSFVKGTDWKATDYTDINNKNLTRIDPAYNGLNVYGDEVAITLNFDKIAEVHSGTFGNATVSRTGYLEEDLWDYDEKNIKGNIALHFKPWADDFEVILNSKAGIARTIFYGSGRIGLDNLVMHQHKIEVRNSNFFLRGYLSAEDGGNTYNTQFTGININRVWKSDKQWFTDYATGYLGAITSGQSSNEAHQTARELSDIGRLEPGSPEFIEAFNRVIQNPNVQEVDLQQKVVQFS